MIRKLLSHRFPSEFGLSLDDVSLPLREEKDTFVLSDNKACIECKKRRADRISCDEEILKIRSSSAVAVLAFEKYMSQYIGTKLKVKDVCDYLLFDESVNHHKIAFCDLTCSAAEWVEPNSGKYPEGKRAKAKTQMLQSLEYLLQEPLLAGNVLTYVERVCLFGWREYGRPEEMADKPVRNSVTNNLQVFGKTPSSMAKQLTYPKNIIGHDFFFVQVKYPSLYEF